MARRISDDKREQIALESLVALGFAVTVHEPPRTVPADALLGRPTDQYFAGTCFVVILGRGGKRKTISAVSAVQAWDLAMSWLNYQKRLKPDDNSRFIPLEPGEVEDNPLGIIQRPSGDTAQTKARQIVRRELEFNADNRLVAAYDAPA